MLNKIILINFVLIINGFANAANINIHKNEESGLLTWTAEDQGFTIELIQLLPDFVRAIYEKHNFPKPEIERIAEYCVFGTIVKNTSSKKLTYKVKNWRYRIYNSAGSAQLRPVKTKTQWLEEWRKAGITFSWTLLPDVGDFEVGDWQQGFTTIDLSRKGKFDLLYKWQLDGVEHTGVLENVECPPTTVSIQIENE
ncbi:MAG: hypothetical protein COA54_14105 [Thiotrichaceae bacterium]|nr:MAG: hypothetical protein COA54_14105 [Thiotrichaceae bacterium]